MKFLKSPAAQKLTELATTKIQLPSVVTPERILRYCTTNGPLTFSYGTAQIDDTILSALGALATELQVVDRFMDIITGKIVNKSENRQVNHHQTRSKNRGHYGKTQEEFSEFATQIHQGEIVSVSGRPFTTVVQIGIGGSDLGPRALITALDRWITATAGRPHLHAQFIANVDPDDAASILSKIDVTTTLFIVVSKSGTTQETLTNETTVRQYLLANGIDDPSRHFVAVTAKNSLMDNPVNYRAVFHIDDAIGGRFSSTSAVGGVILSLAYGPDVFESLLKGAHTLDVAAQSTDLSSNITLLSALIGVWERTFLHYPTKAIVPYSESLSRFVAHLQQLDCESNGKSVTAAGDFCDYPTGPVIFGEPGTNGQHSFFQMLHQGTDIIPVQFIGFRKSQMEMDTIVDGSSSQTKLNANLVGQIIAFAMGKSADDPNEIFSGNRPTTLIIADQLTPYTLGALLAFYENVVAFQGLIWGLNSFDQAGVQLGKRLTTAILTENATPEMAAIMSLLA